MKQVHRKPETKSITKKSSREDLVEVLEYWKEQERIAEPGTSRKSYAAFKVRMFQEKLDRMDKGSKEWMYK